MAAKTAASPVVVSAAHNSSDDEEEEQDDDEVNCSAANGGGGGGGGGAADLSPQSRLARLASAALGGASVTYKDYPKEERHQPTAVVATTTRSYFTIVTVSTEPPHVRSDRRVKKTYFFRVVGLYVVSYGQKETLN